MGRCLSNRAHIMGVRVSDTTAETRIVTLKVIANSRKSRPTMSPIKSNGISTAMSEMVSDKIVNPICSEPLSAALKGSALLDVPRDIFDHDNGIVHDESRGDG